MTNSYKPGTKHTTQSVVYHSCNHDPPPPPPPPFFPDLGESDAQWQSPRSKLTRFILKTTSPSPQPFSLFFFLYFGGHDLLLLFAFCLFLGFLILLLLPFVRLCCLLTTVSLFHGLNVTDARNWADSVQVHVGVLLGRWRSLTQSTCNRTRTRTKSAREGRAQADVSFQNMTVGLHARNTTDQSELTVLYRSVSLASSKWIEWETNIYTSIRSICLCPVQQAAFCVSMFVANWNWAPPTPSKKKVEQEKEMLMLCAGNCFGT